MMLFSPARLTDCPPGMLIQVGVPLPGYRWVLPNPGCALSPQSATKGDWSGLAEEQEADETTVVVQEGCSSSLGSVATPPWPEPVPVLPLSPCSHCPCAPVVPTSPLSPCSHPHKGLGAESGSAGPVLDPAPGAMQTWGRENPRCRERCRIVPPVLRPSIAVARGPEDSFPGCHQANPGWDRLPAHPRQCQHCGEVTTPAPVLRGPGQQPHHWPTSALVALQKEPIFPKSCTDLGSVIHPMIAWGADGAVHVPVWDFIPYPHGKVLGERGGAAAGV